MSTLVRPERSDLWPALPIAEWKDTCEALHMWTQIVGKVRMELTPTINHWWHVPLYVNALGLTTSAIPYGAGLFEIQFDFVHHNLIVATSRGGVKAMPLVPRSVAEFYREFMSMLASLGIDVKIWTMPVEVRDPIPFDHDTQHASYDPEYAARFHRVLMAVSRVLGDFRGRFIGKCSPVHFFWGSFDLAVSRFSGRKAPPRPGADALTAEAYSHEVSSAGWWPGGGAVPDAAFYSYTVPEPAGFAAARVLPPTAFYSQEMHEFLLTYDEVRTSESPENSLMEFLQSTYATGASLGGWDRQALEKGMVEESAA